MRRPRRGPNFDQRLPTVAWGPNGSFTCVAKELAKGSLSTKALAARKSLLPTNLSAAYGTGALRTACRLLLDFQHGSCLLCATALRARGSTLFPFFQAESPLGRKKRVSCGSFPGSFHYRPGHRFKPVPVVGESEGLEGRDPSYGHRHLSDGGMLCLRRLPALRR